MKRIFSLVLSVAICIGVLCTSVSASVPKNQGQLLTAVDNSEVEPRIETAPKEFYNLGGTNKYDQLQLIDLAAARGSYTRYYFATATGRIYVKLDLERSGLSQPPERSLTITLYEKNTASATGTAKETKTVTFNTITAEKRVSFAGLDSNKFYYLLFYNDSGFHPGQNLNISCTGIVDDSYN